MTEVLDRLSPAGLSPTQRNAVTRWKLGHHVFHLLLVALNTRLDEAIDRLAAEDWTATSATLHDLARLYDAATAAMAYAADFPRTEYEVLVRPSMMPPFASEGFSGVYNTEHTVMLAGVRELRRLYKQRRGDGVPPHVQDAWQRLLDAQRDNRHHHMYVCHRFVDEGASLLQRFWAHRDPSERAHEEGSA